jgi:ABC-type transport system involved in cytochrome bd biosynthesis fused ATPase/permease subunit
MPRGLSHWEKHTVSEKHATAAPLAIEGLTFRYHTRTEPALHEISVTLERGELLLVAGASGTWKGTSSSTVRMPVR